MSRKTYRALAALLCLAGAGAPQTAAAQAASIVPDRGFYLGLGGSFAGVKFGEQDVYAIGTSDIYQDGVLEATGEAAGQAIFDMDDQSSLAPTAQAG